MKIGYGYKRLAQSFKAYNVDHIWGDQTPDRLELAALMGAGGKPAGINRGETLLLLQHADIGVHWKERRRALEWFAERGIMVQVRDQEPVLYDTEDKLAAFKLQNGGSRTQSDAGAPLKVKWTADKAHEFAAAWYGPFSRGYVSSEYARITKRKFDEKAVNACNYLFGKRDGTNKTRYINKFGEPPAPKEPKA